MQEGEGEGEGEDRYELWYEGVVGWRVSMVGRHCDVTVVAMVTDGERE